MPILTKRRELGWVSKWWTSEWMLSELWKGINYFFKEKSWNFNKKYNGATGWMLSVEPKFGANETFVSSSAKINKRIHRLVPFLQWIAKWTKWSHREDRRKKNEPKINWKSQPSDLWTNWANNTNSSQKSYFFPNGWITANIRREAHNNGKHTWKGGGSPLCHIATYTWYISHKSQISW